MLAIKKNAFHPGRNEPLVDLAVRRLVETVSKSALRTLFHPLPVLVPVPGSGISLKNSVWPALAIADAMKRAGLAGAVLPALERFAAIRKSAFVRKGSERPLPHEHRDSLQLTQPMLLGTTSILLIDDIVTRGATMVGAAMVIKRHWPDVEVRGFGLARTAFDMKTWIEPVVGTITYDESFGMIRRRP